MNGSSDFNLGDLALARQIVAELRDVDPFGVRINNTGGAGVNNSISLTAVEPALAGRRGTIRSMWETGGGQVRFRLDGAAPSTADGLFLTGDDVIVSLQNVNFDDVLFQFTNTGGDLQVLCEAYK